MNKKIISLFIVLTIVISMMVVSIISARNIKLIKELSSVNDELNLLSEELVELRSYNQIIIEDSRNNKNTITDETSDEMLDKDEVVDGRYTPINFVVSEFHVLIGSYQVKVATGLHALPDYESTVLNQTVNSPVKILSEVINELGEKWVLVEVDKYVD